MTVFEQRVETFLSKWVDENIGSEIAIGSTSFGGNTIWKSVSPKLATHVK